MTRTAYSMQDLFAADHERAVSRANASEDTIRKGVVVRVYSADVLDFDDLKHWHGAKGVIVEHEPGRAQYNAPTWGVRAASGEIKMFYGSELTVLDEPVPADVACNWGS